MEWFDTELTGWEDPRLFTPDYFKNKHKGLYEDIYESMACIANIKYYKYKMLLQLLQYTDPDTDPNVETNIEPNPNPNVETNVETNLYNFKELNFH
jgi:hypothetical protein